MHSKKMRHLTGVVEMSTITGLGRYDLSVPIPRAVSTTSDSDSFLSLLDSTVQTEKVGSSASSSSSASSQQQDEDRQEAFAKMMVSLQNANSLVATPTTSDSSSSGVGQVGASSLNASVDATAGSSAKRALDEFKDYMALTPAQKMRYSTLKGMGLTEADLKAMSPADQAKVEAKIAEVLKKQTEMQASASTGADSNSGSSASAGNQGQSLVNAALLNMTQSLGQEKSRLGLS
jgi:uncharacterized membrane-anchored protein YjiN (DUF445 family)